MTSLREGKLLAQMIEEGSLRVDPYLPDRSAPTPPETCTGILEILERTDLCIDSGYYKAGWVAYGNLEYITITPEGKDIFYVKLSPNKYQSFKKLYDGLYADEEKEIREEKLAKDLGISVDGIGPVREESIVFCDDTVEVNYLVLLNRKEMVNPNLRIFYRHKPV